MDFPWALRGYNTTFVIWCFGCFAFFCAFIENPAYSPVVFLTFLPFSDLNRGEKLKKPRNRFIGWTKNSDELILISFGRLNPILDLGYFWSLRRRFLTNLVSSQRILCNKIKSFKFATFFDFSNNLWKMSSFWICCKPTESPLWLKVYEKNLSRMKPVTFLFNFSRIMFFVF